MTDLVVIYTPIKSVVQIVVSETEKIEMEEPVIESIEIVEKGSKGDAGQAGDNGQDATIPLSNFNFVA